MRVGAFIIAAITMLTTQALATAQPGEPIPHDLEAYDQHGKPQSFDTIKGQKGAVLVFVRSADWCPYCQAQLLEIRDSQKEIEKTGYKVVSISYDSTDKLHKFTIKHDIGYPMLSDKESAIIRAFGILNEKIEPGSRAYGIPDPAIYIVDAKGMIRVRLAEDDYRKRPPATEIIAAIGRLMN